MSSEKKHIKKTKTFTRLVHLVLCWFNAKKSYIEKCSQEINEDSLSLNFVFFKFFDTVFCIF